MSLFDKIFINKHHLFRSVAKDLTVLETDLHQLMELYRQRLSIMKQMEEITEHNMEQQLTDLMTLLRKLKALSERDIKQEHEEEQHVLGLVYLVKQLEKKTSEKDIEESVLEELAILRQDLEQVSKIVSKQIFMLEPERMHFMQTAEVQKTFRKLLIREGEFLFGFHYSTHSDINILHDIEKRVEKLMNQEGLVAKK